MLSTRVLRNFGKVEGRPSMSRIQTPHFVPNMVNGAPVYVLHILLCQESSRVTCCVWRGIVLDKSTRRPGKYTIAENPIVVLAVEDSTQHHYFSPLLGEWHPIPWLRGHGYRPWVGCTNLSVYLPFPAHTDTIISVKRREARLITEVTVPPVPVRSPTHTVASPVIQSQSGTPGGTPTQRGTSQKPVYNAPNWQPPPKSADHLHAQTRCLDETIVPDYSGQLSVFPGCCPTSMPPLMWPTSVSVASQNFAHASLRHTTSLPVIAANSPLSISLQYTRAFAPKNFHSRYLIKKVIPNRPQMNGTGLHGW